MLKEKGFANAAALTSVIAYVIFYLLSVLLPNWFGFLYDSQFFGASASSLFVDGFVFDLWALIVLVVTSWIFGYIFAWAYNKTK